MTGTSSWASLTQETRADTCRTPWPEGPRDGEFSVSTWLDLKMACYLVKRYSG